jgi:hypothetical protein
MYTEVSPITREDLECSIWDAYKDLNGVRPRHLNMKTMSYKELESYLDNLYDDLRDEQEYQSHMDAIELEADRLQEMLNPAPLPWEAEDMYYSGF